MVSGPEAYLSKNPGPFCHLVSDPVKVAFIHRVWRWLTSNMFMFQVPERGKEQMERNKLLLRTSSFLLDTFHLDLAIWPHLLAKKTQKCG